MAGSMMPVSDVIVWQYAAHSIGEQRVPMFAWIGRGALSLMQAGADSVSLRYCDGADNSLGELSCQGAGIGPGRLEREEGSTILFHRMCVMGGCRHMRPVAVDV